MAKRYGARPEAWDEWSKLGVGKDLLPAVANPDAVISPMSKMRDLGKTPSRYNGDGQVVGIAKWTEVTATPAEIARWKAQPDYSLAVQTRGEIKGIDGDVADPVKAKAIRDAITDFLGPCPVRYREGTGKFLIPIRYSEPLPKRVLQVEGGMIEILGDGQQFIADGMHPSGSRYQWNGTALPDMPVVTPDQLAELCAMLEMCFGTADWKIAREKRDGTLLASAEGEVQDDVAGWLVANWRVHGVEDDGRLYIDCPFAGEHTGDSGPSSTAYFPAGTGGYSQGHFVCLHAHCAAREDRDFLDATGYGAAQFADLIPLDAPPEGAGAHGGEKGVVRAEPLALVRDKQGRIEPTADNLVKLLTRPDLVGKWLAYDEFKDELIWAPAHQPLASAQWRAFTDIDYVDIRIQLERRGMKAMGHELLRSTVLHAANAMLIDTAKEWLSRLVWDGVERLESFCSAGWGWEASDYSRAVGRYIWTALAGRVIEPGCQADMAPVLVGPQGAGKTQAIKAMAPTEEHYITIPLDDHDDDTSRRLRGKLVGELEELRGLNSRAIEAIKAWITRTTEGWIPKYKEFESLFKRRIVFFGSTNDDEFLNDPTGERRWLPGRCGELDVEWIKAHRDQLWAEGAAKFMLGGVDWEGAQTLGLAEHHEFKVTDSWEGAVARWLIEPQISGKSPVEQGHVVIADVLSGAVSIPPAHHDRGKEMRMAKVLRGLGWERRRLPTEGRPWAYVQKDAS